MRSWLKAFVVLAVTLPIAAYVVATLGAAPADPTPRSPVILRDPSPAPAPSSPPSQRPQRSKQGGPGDGERDDDEVRVVTPAPTRVDDDGGDDEDERDDDDTSDDGDD